MTQKSDRTLVQELLDAGVLNGGDAEIHETFGQVFVDLYSYSDVIPAGIVEFAEGGHADSDRFVVDLEEAARYAEELATTLKTAYEIIAEHLGDDE